MPPHYSLYGKAVRISSLSLGLAVYDLYRQWNRTSYFSSIKHIRIGSVSALLVLFIYGCLDWLFSHPLITQACFVSVRPRTYLNERFSSGIHRKFSFVSISTCSQATYSTITYYPTLWMLSHKRLGHFMFMEFSKSSGQRSPLCFYKLSFQIFIFKVGICSPLDFVLIAILQSELMG